MKHTPLNLTLKCTEKWLCQGANVAAELSASCRFFTTLWGPRLQQALKGIDDFAGRSPCRGASCFNCIEGGRKTKYPA